MKEFILQLRSYVLWSAVIFCLGFVLGIGSFYLTPQLTEVFVQEMAMFVDSVTGEASQFELVLFIFSNNAVKVLGAVLFGLILGIAPIIFLLANGFIIGLLVFYAINVSGSILPVVMAILPHGSIEIPTVIIASAMGLFLGVHLVKRIRKQSDVTITTRLVQALRFYIVFLVPLLLVASFIEVYLTPVILDALMN